MARSAGFRWIPWNLDHATKHGVSIEEIESVVRHAGAPRAIGDDRFNAIGRGSGGRPIQVGFLIDDDGTIFVIHARPLTRREQTRLRKQGRRTKGDR